MKKVIDDEEIKQQLRFEIEKHLAKGYKKFVIFPFGKIGKFTKEVLNNDYSIQEIEIFDNKLCEINDNIKSLEYLKEYPLEEDTYVLITSNKKDIFNELRTLVKSYVPDSQILDLCARERIPNEELVLENIAKWADFDLEDSIYHLKRSDVHFYLPYWRTDEIQQHILFNDRYYEDENLFYLKQFFGEKLGCGTILDVGANIGNHTLFFALECCASKIISFEPVKETYDILCRNVELNKLEDRVMVYNVGVGEKCCRAEKENYSLENIGATKLVYNEKGSIEICAIDEMDIKERISMIKIDVEGFEVQVLRGAINTIKKNQPCIMLEAWEHSESIFNIIKLLYPLGYRYIQISKRDYIFYIN